MQPIYKQFIEPDCKFPFNKLNRNLCFGGGDGDGGVKLPKVEVPKVEVPKVELPEPAPLPTPNLDQRPNVPAITAPSINVPAPNLDQRLNLDQAMTGSVNTEQFGTPSALDTAALDKTSALLVEDLPEFLKNPYSQLSYRPGEGTLGKALGNVSMESMLGIGGGGSGGGDYGVSDTSTDTTTTDEDTAALESTSTMTEEEKQNRIRRLMASRYGRRQTILTGGTGIQGFGEV